MRPRPDSALRCPSRFRPSDRDHARLLDMLGPALFARLQGVFGGRRIWIPKPGARRPCRACARRLRCIREWRRSGAPVPVIARHVGLSRKSVYRLCAGATASRPRRK